MGLKDILFSKKNVEEIEMNVNYVTNKNGEKFLHIKEFKEFLELSKQEFNSPVEIKVVDKFIDVLNQAL